MKEKTSATLERGVTCMIEKGPRGAFPNSKSSRESAGGLRTLMSQGEGEEMWLRGRIGAGSPPDSRISRLARSRGRLAVCFHRVQGAGSCSIFDSMPSHAYTLSLGNFDTPQKTASSGRLDDIIAICRGGGSHDDPAIGGAGAAGAPDRGRTDLQTDRHIVRGEPGTRPSTPGDFEQLGLPDPTGQAGRSRLRSVGRPSHLLAPCPQIGRA